MRNGHRRQRRSTNRLTGPTEERNCCKKWDGKKVKGSAEQRAGSSHLSPRERLREAQGSGQVIWGHSEEDTMTWLPWRDRATIVRASQIQLRMRLRIRLCRVNLPQQQRTLT